MSYAVVTDPKQKRQFLAPDFEITDWESLKPHYEAAVEKTISSKDDLLAWLKQTNELSAAVDEDMAWRYIKKTCDSMNPELKARFKYFIEEIAPNLEHYQNLIQKKYYDSPYRKELDAEKYKVLNLTVEKDIELFRAENIELESKISLKSNEYGEIMSGLSVEIDGQTVTLQQAGLHLLSQNRELRESVWRKIAERRAVEKDKLDAIYDELVKLRTQVARNAGFDSFTDYKFKSLGRFGYTKADCHAFHEAIEKVAKPIYLQTLQEKQAKLKLDTLRPWDTAVDPTGAEPLRPFQTGEELADKTIELFSRMNADVADMIGTMKRINHFDLSSRVGKEPGGYNYGLAETGVPFIFMNAVGTQSDLTTMVHECGHAVHSFLTRDLELQAFKDVTSEIAELASMSMELMTMDYWDTFYTDPVELKRAKREQILRTITLLPWVATVDAFQEWVYDNPNHIREARTDAWNRIYDRFHGSLPDYSGLEAFKNIVWHRQLHIFEVPFYYIEYGIAQIGALQVWKNYKENPEKGLQNYFNGLKLGYTKTISEVYEAAGVEFNFSAQKMSELFAFVQKELKALKD